jgi:hypothetical protein
MNSTTITFLSIASAALLVILMGLPAMATDSVKIFGSDSAAGDDFGYSVDISAEYAVIGAYYHTVTTSAQGAAYVYKKTGSNAWIFNAKLVASDPWPQVEFGKSVAIDSDRIIVGSPQDNDYGTSSGSAYVFKLDGGNWVQEGKLTPADPGPNQNFGNAVDISGVVAIVGAYGNQDLGNDTGAAYIFDKSGAMWLQRAKLTPLEAEAGAQFGISVSLDSDVAVIGAHGALDLGNFTGAAYVYRKNGAAWIEESRLTPQDATEQMHFGRAVAVEGGVVAVGAFGADEGRGAAYVFTKPSAGWTQSSRLIASDRELGDRFGATVSINGTMLFAGAPDSHISFDGMGAVYAFQSTGDSWEYYGKYWDSAGAAADALGTSIGSASGMMIAGIPFNDETAYSAGAAIIFSDLSPQEPTPTPQQITYDLDMEDTDLQAEELFFLERKCTNSPAGVLAVDEYIILDIYGSYWFWDSWTQALDFKTWTLDPAGTYRDTILEFTWPEVSGTLSGMYFWGAFLEAGTMNLVLYDYVEFGYSGH